jgi:hypothetical protein
MDFHSELRALIARHITPSSQYPIYVVVQAALSSEMDRLDKATNKFSDDEIDDGLDQVDPALRHWVPLDERERR